MALTSLADFKVETLAELLDYTKKMVFLHGFRDVSRLFLTSTAAKAAAASAAVSSTAGTSSTACVFLADLRGRFLGETEG